MQRSGDRVSGSGIKSLIDGQLTFAQSSRPVEDQELAFYQEPFVTASLCLNKRNKLNIEAFQSNKMVKLSSKQVLLTPTCC
ncbi:periplasmic phosphate-binding protein of phosphate ABC transporter [Tolypothrix sp. NIES-4075]|nr:periplasmic phosphate-binding protein of phosphate ABC transporter [Tolypothrix sp. NIES-4075]